MKTRNAIASCAALAVLLVAASLAEETQPKRVVCITGDKSGFAYDGEGWERTLAAQNKGKDNADKDKLPKTDFFIGTADKPVTLTKCLADVADNDTLVIITHGSDDGFFSWHDGKEKKRFNNFGGKDQNSVPVPDGFNKRTGVKIHFVACFSCKLAPPPQDKPRSFCKKILDSMGTKNTCVGAQDVARVGNSISFEKTTKKIGAAARKCLQDNKSYNNYPPVNRPDSPDNQQIQAQKLLDNKDKCPGAQGAKIKTITYVEPYQRIVEGNKESVKKPLLACKDAPGASKQESPDVASCVELSDSEVMPRASSQESVEISEATPPCSDCGEECGAYGLEDPGLALSGPSDNPVIVGSLNSIKAEVSAGISALPGQTIEASVVFGNLHFTAGTLSADQQSTDVVTDEEGHAALGFVADGPGLALIQVSVDDLTQYVYVAAVTP